MQLGFTDANGAMASNTALGVDIPVMIVISGKLGIIFSMERSLFPFGISASVASWS